MFLSRRRGGSSRFTIWKVTILFLGAGIWLGGVITENFQVTAAAIIVVGIGLVLALVERATSRTHDDLEEEEDGADGGG